MRQGVWSLTRTLTTRRGRDQHAPPITPTARPSAASAVLDPRVVTLAEHPELRAEIAAADRAAYPEFMQGSDFEPLWDDVYTEFPEYQLALLDPKTGAMIAHANSVPFAWNGEESDLPGSAVQLFRRAEEDRDAAARPTALGALQAVVHVEHQGGGLSAQVLGAMAAHASALGLPDLFAPIRPNEKDRYPLLSLERYVAWRRSDGMPVDPWMRVHVRLNAEVVAVAPAWTSVVATIAEWERWTGMTFPEDGPYVVPGALVTVEIDGARDRGAYAEPHLWMRYRTPVHHDDTIAAALKTVPLLAGLGGAELDRLAQLSRTVQLAAGQAVVERGGAVDEADAGLYVLASGTVTVRHRGRAPEVLAPGAAFGVATAIHGTEHAASVCAGKPATCVVVPRWYLLGQFQRNATLADGLLRELAGEVQAASRQVASPGPFCPAPTAWDPDRGDSS